MVIFYARHLTRDEKLHFGTDFGLEEEGYQFLQSSIYMLPDVNAFPLKANGSYHDC